MPGMISLVLIPLFCFYHFYKVNAFKAEGSLDFSLPNKEDFEKYKVESLRKYKVFNFNDKRINEEQKLKELRIFSRDLVKKYDTINAAKIHFGSKTDYDTFINVINIVSEEKVPTWALFSDDLYVIANPKPKPQKRSFICGTGIYSKENTLRMEEEKRMNKLRVFQFSFLKKQWIIFVAYFGLVLLNIFVLIKLNRQRYS